MAQKVMPGTPKQRSVGRPAQGKSRRQARIGKPVGLTPIVKTPRAVGNVANSGSLNAS